MYKDTFKGVIMYQNIYNEAMKELQSNQDKILVIKNDCEIHRPNYFVYTDNQSSGDTIKKLCQIQQEY